MSDRREGWYWVKSKNDKAGWFCAEWSGDTWYTSEGEWSGLGSCELGPRIPTPEEPWQCVPKEPTLEMYPFLKSDEMTGYNRWKFALLSAPSPDDHDA